MGLTSKEVITTWNSLERSNSHTGAYIICVPFTLHSTICDKIEGIIPVPVPHRERDVRHIPGTYVPLPVPGTSTVRTYVRTGTGTCVVGEMWGGYRTHVVYIYLQHEFFLYVLYVHTLSSTMGTLFIPVICYNHDLVIGITPYVFAQHVCCRILLK